VDSERRRPNTDTTHSTRGGEEEEVEEGYSELTQWTEEEDVLMWHDYFAPSVLGILRELLDFVEFFCTLSEQ